MLIKKLEDSLNQQIAAIDQQKTSMFTFEQVGKLLNNLEVMRFLKYNDEFQLIEPDQEEELNITRVEIERKIEES